MPVTHTWYLAVGRVYGIKHHTSHYLDVMYYYYPIRVHTKSASYISARYF
jgi:hypothetical protein